MQRFFLLTFAVFSFCLTAQTIDFEVDTNCGVVHDVTLASITVTGVNLVIATSSPGTTAAAEGTDNGGVVVSLADRATFVSFPMADVDADGIYNLDFNPNGTVGNVEMRWYFEVLYDDPANPGANLTTNEFLNTEATDNMAADIPFFACDVNFGLNGPTRKYFVNANQDRHIRSALGRCIPCGGSEWRVNMDYSNAPDAVTVNSGQLTMGGNRYLSYNGSFVFVPLINTGGSVYSMRFPVRSAGDFFVGNFRYNFSVAEETFLMEGTDVFADPGPTDRICDVYYYGARSNFTPANSVKISDYLWGSWEASTPGTAVKPFTASTTVTANQSYLDPDDGFTYYMANGSHLLGVDWGAETPATASDVSITFGSDMATFYTDGTGFISTDGNATGAALLGRTWNVANTTIGSDVTVRYFYSEAEFDAMNSLIGSNGGSAITVDEMGFYKVTSGEDPQDVPNLAPEDVIVINPGGVSTTTFAAGDLASNCDATGLVTRMYADYQVSSFSGGGGGGANMGSTLLPVELTMLEANSIKKNVMVKWATASESGNEGFDVQHSLDGLTFQTIGQVAGAGHSADYRTYSFEHLNTPTGVNFYRLQQQDFDGRTSLSQVVSVRVKGDEAFTIYPNPASSELMLTTGTAISGTVEIRDAQGRLLSATQITAQRQAIDLQELRTGLYFITVRSGQDVVTKRFMKK